MLRIPILVWALFAIANSQYAQGQNWQATTWNGEPAWQATSMAGWVATVSETRARLVSLSAEPNGVNLLFARKSTVLSRGGHRFWLGPQTSWDQFWPPPDDWENSSASDVQIIDGGGTLQVQMPWTNKSYPRVVRTYRWQGNGLQCSARWRAQGHFAMHIVQLPATAVVRVATKVNDALPDDDYALLPLANRPTIRNGGLLPDKVARLDGSTLFLRHAGIEEKIGFRPQTLHADIGKYTLAMERGPSKGRPSKELPPDLGFLSQVYLGDGEYRFVEIEQLSPVLEGGEVLSEIILRPGTRAQP